MFVHMKPAVRAKKHLGQHFLNDENIAQRIAALLSTHGAYTDLIEIGPGTGVLSKYLFYKPYELYCLDVDEESIDYLNRHYGGQPNVHILNQDFLKYNLSMKHSENVGVIGNFPYNISSQIFFHILDHPGKVIEIVCMLQKEVAERLAAPPGNKDYGILSVLLQTFYNIEYCFTVPPHVFIPPPKVTSGVIHLRWKERAPLTCSFDMLKKVVKRAFNQRRKMLRNTLADFIKDKAILQQPIFEKRPEQLWPEEFESIATLIASKM